MQKYIYAVVLSGLLATDPVLRAQNVQILMTGGPFHKGEVTAQSGETWYGLFPEGEKYRLVRTVIQVTQVRDEILNDKENERTGTRVSCDQPGKPLFLVRGIYGLNDKPVDTAWQGDKFFHPGESESYFFDGIHTGIMAFGEALKTEHYSGFYYRDYSLYLIRGSEERSIISFEKLSPDARPHLIWVGDLDNDKKIDMFWDMSEHYYGQKFTLYLSSLAKSGEWLAKAAEFFHVAD